MTKLLEYPICFLFATLILVGISGDTNASSKSAIAGASKLSAKLDGDLGATDLFDIANKVGPFIDEIRRADPSARSLKEMKRIFKDPTKTITYFLLTNTFQTQPFFRT